jgi:hypothetical protein
MPLPLMLITTLHIDDQTFFLEPDEHVESLKRRILDMVRGAAGFLVFSPIGHGVVSVMMTPTTQVRLEEHHRTEDELQDWQEEPEHIQPSFDDFDAFSGTTV